MPTPAIKTKNVGVWGFLHDNFYLLGYYRVRGIHQYQNCCNPLCGTIVKNYEICLDFIVWQI